VLKERDLWVHSYRMPPESNNSIKMEVGIEDCLHIEFEYNKSRYVFDCWHCIDWASVGRLSFFYLAGVVIGTISKM
jgi:vacuolar protein sorting-associated protein 26